MKDDINDAGLQEGRIPWVMEYLSIRYDNPENFQHIQLDDYYDTRLYYKPTEGDRYGFSYYALYVQSYSPDDFTYATDDKYCCENTDVKLIFHGWIKGDSTSHMYFGEEGYVHCVDFKTMRSLMDELSKLEDKYCTA